MPNFQQEDQEVNTYSYGVVGEGRREKELKTSRSKLFLEKLLESTALKTFSLGESKFESESRESVGASFFINDSPLVESTHLLDDYDETKDFLLEDSDGAERTTLSYPMHFIQ